MANSLNGNPYVLDTPDAVNPFHLGHTFCETIEWSGYGNAGDTMIISDGVRGVDILHWVGRADLSPIQISPGNRIRINDPILRVLTSGTVKVFLT